MADLLSLLMCLDDDSFPDVDPSTVDCLDMIKAVVELSIDQASTRSLLREVPSVAMVT